MPLIHVESAGMLTTVQDLGRPGHGVIGVSACGAADPVALRIGNCLVGNIEGAAALEMTLSGGRFSFPDGAVIALTGAEFACNLPFWMTHTVKPGLSLEVGPAKSGARCYLCVRGGIDVPQVLGSRSSHVVSRLGCAPLKAGDILPIGPNPERPARTRVRRAALEKLARRKALLVTPGPQWHLFADGALSASEYEVTESTNRMGIRLRGAPIACQDLGDMTTEGVSLGAIQVPAGGQPIIIFVDAQTTGGYPVIANVISADLPSVGQLRPRDRIGFERTSLEHAREIYIEWERLLQSDELLW